VVQVQVVLNHTNKLEENVVLNHTNKLQENEKVNSIFSSLDKGTAKN